MVELPRNCTCGGFEGSFSSQQLKLVCRILQSTHLLHKVNDIDFFSFWKEDKLPFSMSAVSVFARFRPLRPKEEGCTIQFSQNSITLPKLYEDSTPGRMSSRSSPSLPERRVSTTTYTFPMQEIFPESATQEEVYQGVCRGMIDSVHEGYNATVLAYGQTGTGKSHSMFGTTELPGIVPRFVHDLWNELDDETIMTCTVTFVEIYMEQIHDLLQMTHELQVRETEEKRIFIQGAKQHKVQNAEQVLHLVHKGLETRSVAETHMNQRSSRSHAVLILQLDLKHPDGRHYSPTVHLVDLAGSENVNLSGVTGINMREATNINRSLSTLSLVIKKLKEGDKHIPYRDSKLTRILTNSLGGTARVSFLITVTSAVAHLKETTRSLKLGQDATVMPNQLIEVRAESLDDLRKQLKAEKQVTQEQRVIIEALEAEIQKRSAILEVSDSEEEEEKERSDLDSEEEEKEEEEEKKTLKRLNVHSRSASFVSTGQRDSQGRPMLTVDIPIVPPVSARSSRSVRIAEHVNREALRRMREEHESEASDWETERERIEHQRDELVAQIATLGEHIRLLHTSKTTPSTVSRERDLSSSAIDTSLLEPPAREPEEPAREPIAETSSWGYYVHVGAVTILTSLLAAAVYLQWRLSIVLSVWLLWVSSIVLLLFLW